MWIAAIFNARFIQGYLNCTNRYDTFNAMFDVTAERLLQCSSIRAAVQKSHWLLLTLAIHSLKAGLKTATDWNCLVRVGGMTKIRTSSCMYTVANHKWGYSSVNLQGQVRGRPLQLSARIPRGLRVEIKLLTVDTSP